jgi:hypothetical protein
VGVAAGDIKFPPNKQAVLNRIMMIEMSLYNVLLLIMIISSSPWLETAGIMIAAVKLYLLKVRKRAKHYRTAFYLNGI